MWSLFALALLIPTGGHAAWQPDAMAVARNLDVTSFSNSIGPRRRAGAMTLAAYGFDRFTRTARGVEARQGASWTFEVDVLSATPDGAVICVTDQATNGGSYRTVGVVEVARQGDGLWRATGRQVSDSRCVARA